MRGGVAQLLQADWTLRPAIQDLLHECTPTPVLVFPTYFPLLHRYLYEVKASPPSKRAEATRRWLNDLIDIDDEGLEIALPMIIECFNHPEAQLEMLDMFDSISLRLGRAKTNALFLKPLSVLFEVGWV